MRRVLGWSAKFGRADLLSASSRMVMPLKSLVMLCRFEGEAVERVGVVYEYVACGADCMGDC